MCESNLNLQSYFGKWGGFFVPDPMTPALDDLASTSLSLFQDEKLKDQVKDVVHIVKNRIGELKTTKFESIFSIESLAQWYVMAGYGSLAKVSQREIVFGATTSEEAKIVLTICKKLELPLSIWLNVSTGSDAELVEELKANKANINVDQCRELFDDPDMYAFQKYISNPAKYLWAPIHTHSGPAPFPALTAYFSEVAAEDMMAFVFSKFPGRKVNFIAPAFPGISLAGLINVNCKQSLKLSSYEPKMDSQREECYLGMYTKVANVGRKEFIFSPELLNAWETGSVQRIVTISPIETMADMNLEDVSVVIED